MRGRTLLLGAVIVLGVPLVASAKDPGQALTSCSMTFNLKGWSVFFKEATGQGTVTCDNGQRAEVDLKVQGGGLSFGKYDVLDGKGTFSKVKSLDEIFGNYAAAGVEAGIVKSAAASAYTKGEISLAVAGTGRGMDIGFDFGKLAISRASGGR